MGVVKPHICLPIELDEKVRKYLSDNRLSYSQATSTLIEKGLNDRELREEIELLVKTVEKLNNKINYTRDLLEQLYTDLEIENSLKPKENKALQTFKKNCP